jgi:hypothetical protein
LVLDEVIARPRSGHFMQYICNFNYQTVLLVPIDIVALLINFIAIDEAFNRFAIRF